MHSNWRQHARPSHCVALAIAALSVVAGCASNNATTAATSPSTAQSSLGTTPAVGVSNSAATADTLGASNATIAPKPTTSTKKPGVTTTTVAAVLPGGGGPDDPCGIVTLADVQAVLPGAGDGVATLPSGGSGSIVAGTCVFKVDQEHRVVIVVETGPTQVMSAAKAGAAAKSDFSKVAGLGDAGYSSTQTDGTIVVFYVGDTQVLITAFGQQDAAPVVALAKKAAASF